MNERPGFPTAAEVPPEARDHLRDLLLTLADNKRLLGIRYSDWILGAPSVEAGIACSAMAQDEWGHGRIVYAMLKDFGLDPGALEHEREASEYRSSALLDAPIETWPGMMALNLLLDTAISVQFEAMESSRFEPIHYKARKLLEEERFHFEHARGWAARLAMTDAGREALQEALEPAWRDCLRGFGPSGDPLARSLADAGITSGDADVLRARWLERVGPVVEASGLPFAEQTPDGWASDREIDWEGWSAERRRDADGGPDPETLSRVRGDLNRALLMD
jgi:phenylacetate-CoA oxygenase PaaI subunit